jgi:hypothetical protein
MKTLVSIFILLVAAISHAQTTYTLNLADGTTTVAAPHRAGINLASANYYDNGQIYKNLLAEDNYGFENTLSQQIWALSVSGSKTTFCNTNQYAVYPLNFWAGATVSVVESSGPEAGYQGVVASSSTGGSNSPACYTVATPAPAAFAAGDEVIITLNQFPTAESCWETSTNCGVWTYLGNGGKLLTDSTTPYDGKQSLIMDVTSGIHATSGVALYFDSDQENRFILLNGNYELTGWMKTGAAAINHVLTLCAGRVGSTQCQNVTPTSTWTQFSLPFSFADTNTATGFGIVTAQIAGTNGLGQVEIDDLSLEKTSNQDSNNTTIFRDEFVAALRQYCATEVPGPSCIIRNWTNQNGETMQNWTTPQAAASQTTAGGGATTYGNITPRLNDYLNLVKLVGGVPYFVEPVTFQGNDPANLVEYLASTNTSTGYGEIRASQGQVEPWVGSDGVFPDVYISFCNECWNSSSFSGQALPYRTAEANDYYHDYWNRAKDVFAQMRADSNFVPNIHLGFNLQLGVNYAPGGLDTALRGMAEVGGAADYVEQAPYQQSTVSSWQTDANLWGSAMEQPWDDAANPSSASGYNQAVRAIQSYNLCGANGTTPCFATDYEQANSTVATCGVAGFPACTGGNNQAIDQPHEDIITAGSGEGVIAGLQAALNQQQLGITTQNYFGATEFANGTLYGGTATTSKLWGLCVDYGGATSYLNNESYSCRPQFFGLSILNQAIIGPEYACSLASGPSYNWPGSALNGPTAAQNGVPFVYPFCFEKASSNQRSIVLFNTSLTTSYTINFAGSNVPNGTCAQQQYAPSSPDLLNEAASGVPTNTTAATTGIASSSITCGASMTLPPDSETAITYTASGPISQPAGTPRFSLASGTYTATQTVAIASATPSATVYYTTDGSLPTAASTQYAGPMAVSSSVTVNAIAVANGYANSPVATAAYTVTQPTASAPAFSVNSGTYTGAQYVTISDSTSGAVIYYTTNGTLPTAASALYTGTINVGSSETINAIAIATGYANSQVNSATYTIQTGTPTAAPSISPAGGLFYNATPATIAAASGATIYYTLDGSTPSTASAIYSGPITISSSETLSAAAALKGGPLSSITVASFTLDAATPVISPASGTFTGSVSVTISSASTNAKIYYTTNGTVPTVSSNLYTGPVTISATETIYAMTAEPGFVQSPLGVASYTIISTPAAAPTFTPAAGTYTSAQSVALMDSTPGAVIYYTTNGTTPTTASAKYAGAISVNANETLNAIAVATSYSNSPVGSASYIVQLPAAAPVISLAPGTYTSTQTVTISDATAGAVIYYTTNGSTPTTASTRYVDSFTVNSTETINAIAVASGCSTSPKATATYTIHLTTATPAFSLATGTFTAVQSVTISDATAGASIYYTTNGSTPTASSTLYTGAIKVATTETISAIAIASGFSTSPIASSSYSINIPGQTAVPTFVELPGTYTTSVNVQMNDATLGAVIYYTTNGTTPTSASMRYNGYIPVGKTEMLKVIAITPGYTASSVVSGTFTIAPFAATPVFSLGGGTYSKSQAVTISDQTAGAVIHYTTDQSTPTASSPIYTKPFTVTGSEYVQAIAIAPGYTNSFIAAEMYSITQ